MKQMWAVLLAVVVIAGACGGDDDDAFGGIASDDLEASADSDQDQDDDFPGDTEFDLADLPDDFPRELVPPAYETGLVAEIAEIRSVTFERGISYDEAVAYYTDLRGEPNIVVGEEGMHLAQWTEETDWIISIFEEDGPLIGFTGAEILEE